MPPSYLRYLHASWLSVRTSRAWEKFVAAEGCHNFGVFRGTELQSFFDRAKHIWDSQIRTDSYEEQGEEAEHVLSNNDFEAICSDPFLTYNKDQWECQDPKMEVLYHLRPKFLGIFPYIGLKNRPYVWYIGTSNQSNPGMNSHWKGQKSSVGPQIWHLFLPKSWEFSWPPFGLPQEFLHGPRRIIPGNPRMFSVMTNGDSMVI